MARPDRYKELEEKMTKQLKPSHREPKTSRSQKTVEPTIAMTVRLPRPLWKAAHYTRIQTRKAVNQLIVEALERYLRELEHEER